MPKKLSRKRSVAAHSILAGYDDVLAGMVGLVEAARQASARAVNSVMTQTYWEIGRP